MNSAAIVAVSFGVALIITRALIPLLWRFEFIDHPVDRSSHLKSTPRGGGLGILLGALAAVLASGPAVASPEVRTLTLCAALLMTIGGCDDRVGLPVLVRLLGQTLAASWFVATVHPIAHVTVSASVQLPLGSMGWVASVIWIVAVTNAFNFLDGIDGLAGAQGAVVGLGVAAANWSGASTALGLALAGGCLGFLVWNWHPARVFMGDVGSGTLGFLFAALPFLAPQPERSASVLFVALSLWFFLADASWTIVRRLARGDRIWHPHREHCYQRIVSGGASHSNLTMAIAAAASGVTATAALWWRTGRSEVALTAVGLAATIFAVELWLAAHSHPPVTPPATPETSCVF